MSIALIMEVWIQRIAAAQEYKEDAIFIAMALLFWLIQVKKFMNGQQNWMSFHKSEVSQKLHWLYICGHLQYEFHAKLAKTHHMFPKWQCNDNNNEIFFKYNKQFWFSYFIKIWRRNWESIRNFYITMYFLLHTLYLWSPITELKFSLAIPAIHFTTNLAKSKPSHTLLEKS